jgi:hypothetical protein
MNALMSRDLRRNGVVVRVEFAKRVLEQPGNGKGKKGIGVILPLSCRAFFDYLPAIEVRGVYSEVAKQSESTLKHDV